MNSLLPPNAVWIERALEAAIGTVRDVPRPVLELYRPFECPLGALAFLAWAESVDVWDATWPEEVKRSQVDAAPRIHLLKGTAAAVRSVVRAFGGGVALREWWQLTPKGPPHTFQLVLTLTGENGQAATAAFVDQVIEAVRRAKPERSHFEFQLGLGAAGGVAVAAVARPVGYLRLDGTAPAAGASA